MTGFRNEGSLTATGLAVRSLATEMTRHHSGPNAGITRAEFVIVAVILCGLVAMLYPVVQRTRNPNGPHGEIYPSVAPNEANRITHQTGLSIILPENWDDLSGTSPILRIACRGTPLQRLSSVITISQRNPKPDQQTLARYKAIQFQGYPAYEMCSTERKDFLDDPATSSYDLLIQREDVWWHVNYMVADEMSVLPNSIRQYIETIEFPEPEQNKRTDG